MVKILANRRIEVDIIANDRASSVFYNIRNASSGMSSTLMTALGGTAGAISGFDNALRSYNSSMYRFNRVVTRAVIASGEAVYNFTKDAINNFTELERQHAKTMGAMATSYDKTAEAQARFLSDSEKLKQQAKILGTYGPNGNGALNTVNEVSYAQTALVKSGMTANDILGSDALESVLKFAGGNDLDVDTATTFAVNMATVFDKPVEKWGEMLDMITKAADISVIDVEDIMNSLTYTGGIASGLDRDLEEVLGIISIMGQAGLRGRVAGTGLQSFFTRILSAGELSDIEVGNAPTKHAANLYDQFVLSATNGEGTFKAMDEVAEALNVAMEDMNDQEQAWFAKKLFGLYQMKAAYALTGAVDGDTNLITDFIDQIANESKGTNDIKYELMQSSQYGKLTSLGNVWEGIKTDLGDKLSPVVSAVADELLAFLKDPQNYEINWDTLRDAISESGDEIGKQYGIEIGNAIANIGNWGIDAALIGGTLVPQVGGIISGIGKLLNGDISGALDDFKSGIDDTNNEIENLPPELQDTAEAARNVIAAFTILSGINLATNIAQIFTSALNLFIAKPISAITSRINSTNANVTSANSTITATSVTVTAGTATSVNIGSIPVMNVTAGVVNVYGGNGYNPTNPTTPTTPTTPQLPSVPVIPVLPSGGNTLQLPGGNSIPQLPGSGTSTIVGDPSKATTLHNFFGTYMTKSQIIKSVLGTAGKAVGLASIFATLLSLGGDSPQQDIYYKNAMGEGIEKGYEGDVLKQYILDYMAERADILNVGEGQGTTNFLNQIGAYFDAQMGLYEKWTDDTYKEEALEAIRAEIEEQGRLSDDFLKSLVTNEIKTDDGREGKYIGTQADLTTLFKLLFGEDYKQPNVYSGFADQYTTKYVKGKLPTGTTSPAVGLISPTDNIKNKLTGSFAQDYGFNAKEIISGTQSVVESSQTVVSGSQTVVENSQNVITASQNVITASQSVIDSVNDAMSRVQRPIINVNVSTKVDKNGNATSSVTQNNLLSNLARFGNRFP